MNIKIRLNVIFEGKKFRQLLPEISIKIGEFKMVLAEKLGLKDKVDQIGLFTADDFSLDIGSNEFAAHLFEDNDTVVVKLGAQPCPTPSPLPASVISPPSIPLAYQTIQVAPYSIPLANQPIQVAPPSIPVVAPFIPIALPMQVSQQINLPIPSNEPKEEKKAVYIPSMHGREFKYRLLRKDQGFEPISDFDFPAPSEKLDHFCLRLLTYLNIPIAVYGAFFYHETGAPISVNLSQQELINCGEVFDKGAIHYVIPVPKIIETPQPNVCLDPADGPDKVTVEFLGRKFNVQATFNKTTVLELKEKLSIFLKVS